MNLAMHVRIVLTEYNRRGYSFDEAWMLSMRSLPKGKNQIEKAALAEWKEVLRWAKPHFAECFAHLPASDRAKQPDQQNHDHHGNQEPQQDRDGVRLTAL
jgi:hypothetical protein